MTGAMFKRCLMSLAAAEKDRIRCEQAVQLMPGSKRAKDALELAICIEAVARRLVDEAQAELSAQSAAMIGGR